MTLPTLLTEPLFLGCALIAVLIAGLSKGGFGSGAAFASTPILALAVPPVDAAAILLPILCIMDLVGLYSYRGQWDHRNARALMLACVPGVVLGALTFGMVSVAFLKILIGVIAFAFLAWTLVRARGGLQLAPSGFSRLRALICGALAGYTSFVAHAGGPPVAIHLLPQGLDKTRYQATTVLFFWWVNLIKLPFYAGLGLFSAGRFDVSLWLLPLAAACMALGIYAHRHVSERWFYRVVYTLLAITAGKLLWDGALAA